MKKRRLPFAGYDRVGLICSVTMTVAGRRRVFADRAVAASAVDALRDRAGKDGVTVYAYCVMPDHVHVVMSPCAECDVSTFIGRFKNVAQRAAWQRGVEGAFWDKSFWDRILRAEDDLETIVRYILENPVRAGMVSEWFHDDHVGSLAIDLSEWRE